MKGTLLLAILFISPSLFAKTTDEAITVMSLNIYGWKTMPKHSDDYAKLIKRNQVDVLGIQEGVEDWQLKGNAINNKLPTNYQRAITLKKSLGQCWQHKFQIFINHCQGNRFIESGRFDLTDGPNATRTGEYAVIEKRNKRYLIVNVHWDHESVETRVANAKETSAQLNKVKQYPKILLGDFNSHCESKEVSLVQSNAGMTLIKNAGIDCLFVKNLTGKAKEIVAYPSDHPAIVASLVYPSSSAQ
ncbi:endonuclease/exonuclease/phosphatase family protein [Colwellia piezophila]|uniref:endonuclease/exonuclease/phosphatase family protein n=1 Tax=Colwellia piezophila TaxID=211668 RepID=UPI00146EAAA9|nr:endonuclease/exonuclease/phosphatase family protein [Colwellia piezophila]